MRIPVAHVLTQFTFNDGKENDCQALPFLRHNIIHIHNDAQDNLCCACEPRDYSYNILTCALGYSYCKALLVPVPAHCAWVL